VYEGLTLVDTVKLGETVTLTLIVSEGVNEGLTLVDAV